MEKDFRKELEHLINRHSLENGSNTPDFVLANFLCNCLAAFDAAVNRRDGLKPKPPTVSELEEVLRND